MELQNRFNDALAYLEESLESKIDYAVLAQKAACSEFHFQRMFSSLTGISLSEYVRRRRLTAAAFELQKEKAKIIDVALKYGYDSPDAFTRAFRRLHGVTPAEVKESGVFVAAYPPLSFQITLKGTVKMEYRMEEIDFSPRFVGKKSTVENKRAFESIPSLWAQSAKNGFRQKLIGLTWENPKCKLEGLVGIVGESADIQTETFTYFMGGRYDGTVPEGMEAVVLPPCIYTVFPAKEFRNAKDIWGRIYAEWLPSSGYELADQPCVEHYPEPGSAYAFEVWLPVRKPNCARLEK